MQKARGRNPIGWKAAFLRQFANTPVIATSAKAVGVTRDTIHKYLRTDPEFKAQFEDLAPNRVSFYEDCAAKSAASGMPAAFIFMLKKLKPEIYGDASEMVKEFRILVAELKKQNNNVVQPLPDAVPVPLPIPPQDVAPPEPGDAA